MRKRWKGDRRRLRFEEKTMRSVHSVALILCLAGCFTPPSSLKPSGTMISLSVFGLFVRQAKPGFGVLEFLSDYGLMEKDKRGWGNWGVFNKEGGHDRKMYMGKLAGKKRLVEGGGAFAVSFLPPFQREAISMFNGNLARFCVEAQESGFRVLKWSAVREDGLRKTRLDLLNLREHTRRKMKVSSFQGLLLKPRSGDVQTDIQVVPFIVDCSGARLGPLTTETYGKIKAGRVFELKEGPGQALLRGWLERSFSCPHCGKRVWGISFPRFPVFSEEASQKSKHRQLILRLILSLRYEYRLWAEKRREDGIPFRGGRKGAEWIPGKLFGLCKYCHKEVYLSFVPIERRPKIAISKVDTSHSSQCFPR